MRRIRFRGRVQTTGLDFANMTLGQTFRYGDAHGRRPINVEAAPGLNAQKQVARQGKVEAGEWNLPAACKRDNQAV